MKLLILASVFACIFAAPSRMFMPRLPLSVLLSGKFQMIPEDKIVGGTEVTPYSLPFQISLQRKYGSDYSHMCGGSILDETTIIDAAHCVAGVSPNNLRVAAGEHSLSKNEGNEQYSDVASTIAHENYSARTLENDISIIKLTNPLIFNGQVQPVSLPPSLSDLDAGTLITVSGWGTTSEGGSLSDVLLSVEMPVVSDADCEVAYGTGSIYPSMLCAGAQKGGVDSCQGDSGGPLFINESGNFVQHGIVSWGTGCARPDIPGVYTQVSYFLDWIETNRV